jgi:hypothetical protein
MIDNQADYERIFHARARLPRSPSHQGVSTSSTVPSSSSAGFTTQTQSAAEVSSVPTAAVVTKPRPSQPVSPPPQVFSCLHI